MSDQLNPFSTYLSSLLGEFVGCNSKPTQKWWQICWKSVQLVKGSSFRNDLLQNLRRVSFLKKCWILIVGFILPLPYHPDGTQKWEKKWFILELHPYQTWKMNKKWNTTNGISGLYSFWLFNASCFTCQGIFGRHQKMAKLRCLLVTYKNLC